MKPMVAVLTNIWLIVFVSALVVGASLAALVAFHRDVDTSIVIDIRPPNTTKSTSHEKKPAAFVFGEHEHNAYQIRFELYSMPTGSHLYLTGIRDAQACSTTEADNKFTVSNSGSHEVAAASAAAELPFEDVYDIEFTTSTTSPWDENTRVLICEIRPAAAETFSGRTLTLVVGIRRKDDQPEDEGDGPPLLPFHRSIDVDASFDEIRGAHDISLVGGAQIPDADTGARRIRLSDSIHPRVRATWQDEPSRQLRDVLLLLSGAVFGTGGAALIEWIQTALEGKPNPDPGYSKPRRARRRRHVRPMKKR